MPEGVSKKLLDISKIKRLGWTPKTKLSKGLGKTIKYFRENFDKSY